MRGQLALPRAYDLPPHWDGLAASWEGWADPPVVFVCPPPRQRAVCPACGSTEPRITNRALVALDPATTVERIANYAQFRRVGAVARWRLVAWRCTDCGHDQVSDADTGQLWDLDPADYTDAGSVAP